MPPGPIDRRDFLNCGVAAIAAPFVVARGAARPRAAQAPPPLPAPGSDGWISIFNGRNLDGWYTYLQRSGRNDAQGIVRVEDGMIHILGNEMSDSVESGFVSTLAEFENCRIRVEYKWGVKRFPPRLENKPDNGLLYYVVGPDRVFPRCIECQIQETDVGDVFFVDNVRGVQGDLLHFPQGGGDPPVYPQVGSRLLKDGDFENRTGWNTVEVITEGDRAAHLVNGRIVNTLYNIEQPDPGRPGQFIPLTRGRIALEIEYAEIWFRNLAVKPIPAVGPPSR